MTFVTPLFRYRDFDRRVAFVNAELEGIRAIPGVVSAGAISRIPLTVTEQSTFYLLEGQLSSAAREGRFFDQSDRRSQAPAAIVNESFADLRFSGRSALGGRFKFGRLGDKGYWYTIVGVVKEIRERGVTESLQPAIYRLHEQADQSGDEPSGIVVRTTVEPASIMPAVREAIWSVDRNQPITRVQTIEDVVARQLAVPTQNATLLGAFALLALLLASVGLYGVLSYAVTQRTNEIGVRMALGASPANILVSFSRRGLVLTLVGLVLGLCLTVVTARLMTTLFYDYRPDYRPTAALVALVLLTVAALACLVPARRASRIDPMVALQHE